MILYQMEPSFNGMRTFSWEFGPVVIKSMCFKVFIGVILLTVESLGSNQWRFNLNYGLEKYG